MPMWANVLAHTALAVIALGMALLLLAAGHAMYVDRDADEVKI
jgi:hypothetical protein